MARIIQRGYNVKLWLKRQGYLDHLTLKVSNVALNDFCCWKRIDAHLCMVLKNTIQSSLKPMFRTYDTCYEVWEKAKLLYTSDTHGAGKLRVVAIPTLPAG